MDDKIIFGKQDHIKFDVDSEIWNVFYSDAR